MAARVRWHTHLSFHSPCTTGVINCVMPNKTRLRWFRLSFSITAAAVKHARAVRAVCVEHYKSHLATNRCKSRYAMQCTHPSEGMRSIWEYSTSSRYLKNTAMKSYTCVTLLSFDYLTQPSLRPPALGRYRKVFASPAHLPAASPAMASCSCRRCRTGRSSG